MSGETDDLRFQLTRMADLADQRLIAIHKALKPEEFGISGIESAEDAVAYMTGVLLPILRPQSSDVAISVRAAITKAGG